MHIDVSFKVISVELFFHLFLTNLTFRIEISYTVSLKNIVCFVKLRIKCVFFFQTSFIERFFYSDFSIFNTYLKNWSNRQKYMCVQILWSILEIFILFGLILYEVFQALLIKNVIETLSHSNVILFLSYAYPATWRYPSPDNWRPILRTFPSFIKEKGLNKGSCKTLKWLKFQNLRFNTQLNII